jgi:hypothetical protein
MGFFYDERRGLLEGMPLDAEGPGSVTLATRHFSSFFVSSVEEALLKGPIETGFKADADAWQMNNFNSDVINGHCAGMTTSSIWHYLEQPDGPGARLWGRYDGIQGKATPAYQGDDVFAIRLVDYVQTDYEDSRIEIERHFKDAVNQSPETTFKLFAYSMLVTRSPQLAEIPGHAIVANRVSGGSLGIVDPNFAGEQRQASLAGGNLSYVTRYGEKPVYYMAVTALVDWGQIANRWQALKDNAIPGMRERFIAYDLKTGDATDFRGSYLDGAALAALAPLADGSQSKTQKIFILAVESEYKEDADGIWLYKIEVADCWLNGARVPQKIRAAFPGEAHQGYVVELAPGNNLIGLEIGGLNCASKYDRPHGGSQGWADFVYLNVTYQKPG